jgi:hypothetical protein
METNHSRRRAALVRRGARGGRLALMGICAVAIAPRPARAQDWVLPAPCDDLVVYLRTALADPVPYPLRDGSGMIPERELEKRLEDRLTSSWHSESRAYTSRVTPLCRAQTRRGAALEAAAGRAWTHRTERGWSDRGRILLCTMQDPASLDEVAGWMDDPSSPDVRAICASELATWPAADGIRGAIFARAVQKRGFGWAVDHAVVAAANVMGTSELREQLVPVLATAHEHHARGYDRLRDGVCTDDGKMSAERTRACATLPDGAEDEWPQSGRTARWLVKGAATAVLAGAVTAAAVEGRNETGRAVATGAGVPMGAGLGLTIAGIAMYAERDPGQMKRSDSTGSKVWGTVGLLGGAVAGGVAGAMVAHHYAASPGECVAVTAVALAPVYFTVVIAVSVD